MSDLVGNPEDRFSRVAAHNIKASNVQDANHYVDMLILLLAFGLLREKTNNLGFHPGPTQTRQYSHRK